MKKLIIISLILLFPLICSGGKIVCDPAPIADNVVNVVVVQDGAEIISPYAVTDGYVILVDVSTIAQANFEFMFENDQGRRSDPTPFILKNKPAGCQNTRIIHD